MENQHYYLKDTVTALLQTPAVNSFTKKVLFERMGLKESGPLFFTAGEFKLLTLVSDLLTAQNNTTRICNPAIAIDQRLANDKSNGWRYDSMPPDRQAYNNGLQGIEEAAIKLFDKNFESLTQQQQLQLLQKLQKGQVEGKVWETLPANIFFEELLAEITGIFYSHPLVQEEIGFVGMADVYGWQTTGLSQRDAIEPEEKIQ